MKKKTIILYILLLLLPYETINYKGITYSKILFLVSIVLFVLLLKREKKAFKILFSKKHSLFFIIMLLLFALTTSISFVFSFKNNNILILSNIYEILRPILYALIYFNVAIIFSNEQNLRIANSSVLVVIIINCVVAISQFINPLNINELYVKLVAPTQYVTLVNGYPNPRVIGLTGNPNVFAYLLAVSIIFVLSLILKNSRKIKYYLIYILLHITLYMTMSRTGIIICVLGEIIFVFIYYVNFSKFKETILKGIKCVLLVCLIEIIILFLLPNKLTWRIKELMVPNSINSWEARVSKNEKYAKSFKDGLIIDKTDSVSLDDKIFAKKINYIIGNGPDKISLIEEKVYDNEFTLIFIRYGIIGLIVYLGIFIFPLLKIRQYSKFQKSFYFSVTLINLVYMYPAGIYHSYKLFPFLILIYSLFDYNLVNKNIIDNKNLLVIATYFPPCGGVGVFRITKFVKYLQEYGYKISVITIPEKFYSNLDNDLIKNFNKKIIINQINFSTKKESRVSIDFYFALKKELNTIMLKYKPNMVFITGGPFYILPIGRYIKSNYGVSYIIDMRDPWSTQKQAGNYFKRKLKSFIDNALEKYTFVEAKAIITVNDTMTSELKAKYPSLKEKFYTISNGYDLEDYKDIKSKKFSKFTIIYTGKFFVSAGFRNPELFFKSLNSLVQEGYNINFIHIGQKEQEVINLATKYKIKNRCKFLGFLPHEKVLEYCKGADLLLVISGKEKSEQTGKIFDYIGCNRPILAITNKKNELYKICKQFEFIFQANPNSTEEIIKIIKNIYNNPNIGTVFNNNDKLTRKSLTRDLIKIIEK